MTVVDALHAVLPAEVVVTDPDILSTLAADRAAWVRPGRALAAVRARSTEQVQAVLRVAHASGTPVVPRGGGSGLSGGASAVDGCIVLSLEAMTACTVHPDAMVAVVQPGLVNADLGAAAARHGLFYAPDPASRDFSTIGGNIATNAGGLCCVKYGVTADAVLALEAVLADGELLRTGTATVKDVAGLDLTRLLVGSEGTLAVVTEATLRLLPAPAPASTVVASFSSTAAAAAAATAVVRTCRPSMLELMDATTLAAVEQARPMGLDPDVAALLLGRSDAPGAAGEAEVQLVARCCTDAGATFVHVTADAAEGDLLLGARRLALPALERLGPLLLDDICVPLDRLADAIDAIDRVARAHAVRIGTFGHAGDGNLHPTIIVPHAADGTARAQAAFDSLLVEARALGGTVTGEHGVGVLKRAALSKQVGPVAARVQWAIKDALDPRGILNPGKGLPVRSR
jgi:glycolate oxidase